VLPKMQQRKSAVETRILFMEKVRFVLSETAIKTVVNWLNLQVKFV
jgi:hypothetical protein